MLQDRPTSPHDINCHKTAATIWYPILVTVPTSSDSPGVSPRVGSSSRSPGCAQRPSQHCTVPQQQLHQLTCTDIGTLLSRWIIVALLAAVAVPPHIDLTQFLLPRHVLNRFALIHAATQLLPTNAAHTWAKGVSLERYTVCGATWQTCRKVVPPRSHHKSLAVPSGLATDLLAQARHITSGCVRETHLQLYTEPWRVCPSSSQSIIPVVHVAKMPRGNSSAHVVLPGNFAMILPATGGSICACRRTCRLKHKGRNSTSPRLRHFCSVTFAAM